MQERLYKEASLRQERINELKEDIFRAKCPFKPITNTLQASASSKKGPPTGLGIENINFDMSTISYKPTVVNLSLVENTSPKPKNKVVSKPVEKRVTNKSQVRQKAKKEEDNSAAFSFRDSEATRSTTAHSNSQLRPNDSQKAMTSVSGSISDMSYRMANKENIGAKRKTGRPTPLAFARPQISVDETDEYCPTFGNFKLMNIN